MKWKWRESEIAKAEDRLLEQMVNGEEYDRRIKASEKLLKEVEEVARGLRSTLETEKAATEKELAEANHRTANASPQKFPKTRSIITTASCASMTTSPSPKSKTKGCSACGVRIRPHMIQKMRRADATELFHCETCTRILQLLAQHRRRFRRRRCSSNAHRRPLIRKVSPPSSARLFPDATTKNPPAGVHVANIDGASRGNPGPASYAVVVRNADGEIIEKLAKNIGRPDQQRRRILRPDRRARLRHQPQHLRSKNSQRLRTASSARCRAATK